MKCISLFLLPKGRKKRKIFTPTARELLLFGRSRQACNVTIKACISRARTGTLTSPQMRSNFNLNILLVRVTYCKIAIQFTAPLPVNFAQFANRDLSCISIPTLSTVFADKSLAQVRLDPLNILIVPVRSPTNLVFR